jgi:hypothetical protein
MPTGLSQLEGLSGFVIENPEASPEDRSGNAADPRHEKVGEQAEPYSWQSLQVPGAALPTVDDIGEGFIDDGITEYWTQTASNVEELPSGDTAPWTHAGPWPSDPIGDGSVSPDNLVRNAMINAELRSQKVGPNPRAIFRPQANPQQDNWNEIWNVDPNSDDIPEVSNQMKAALAPGGRGSTDRRQSFARQNQYGFDSRHMHRRFAFNHIPGNNLWMRPASRPLVKTIPGPAKLPIGPTSQFAGQDPGLAFGTQGAILNDLPNAYNPPPTPNVDQAPITGSVESYSYTDYYGM